MHACGHAAVNDRLAEAAILGDDSTLEGVAILVATNWQTAARNSTAGKRGNIFGNFRKWEKEGGRVFQRTARLSKVN